MEKLDNLVKSVEWMKLGVVSDKCPPDRKGLGCWTCTSIIQWSQKVTSQCDWQYISLSSSVFVTTSGLLDKYCHQECSQNLLVCWAGLKALVLYPKNTIQPFYQCFRFPACKNKFVVWEDLFYCDLNKFRASFSKHQRLLTRFYQCLWNRFSYILSIEK